MKLKLTLEGSGEPADLAITLDSQTTVGQLADAVEQLKTA